MSTPIGVLFLLPAHNSIETAQLAGTKAAPFSKVGIVKTVKFFHVYIAMAISYINKNILKNGREVPFIHGKHETMHKRKIYKYRVNG